MSNPKWTCTKCGLQVDDRRVPNNCGGVKGQSHEWEDTEEYNKQQEEIKWQTWISSQEGIAWVHENEKVSSFLQESVVSLQKGCKKAYELGIAKNKEIEEMGKQLVHEKTLIENEMYEAQEKKKREMERKTKSVKRLTHILQILAFASACLSWMTGQWILCLSMAGIFFVVSIIVKRSKIKTASVDENRNTSKISDYNNRYAIYKSDVDKLRAYFTQTAQKYNEEIKNIIHRGQQMLRDNNAKYNVTREYSLINSDMEFRNKIINDEDFVREYKIYDYSTGFF